MLMALAMSGATQEDAGLASGLVNTAAQVGGAPGLAVPATLSTSRTVGLLAGGTPTPAAGGPASLHRVATLETGHTDYDRAYAKAARDVAANIVAGGFVAGQDWPQVWVRDASYAVDLGCGLAFPMVARQTMSSVVTADGWWAQDRSAHFGGWPHLTDSVSGTIGAWASYVAHPDPGFLRRAYEVTARHLARAERQVFDGGLFRGCASFMESNSAYPLRYLFNGRAVARTKALSTNVLYYRGYVLAARMAGLLGEDPAAWQAKAAALQRAINQRLWLPKHGHYAYYEGAAGVRSPRKEGLGHALAILWGVAGSARAAQIFQTMTITGYGIPCLWPRHWFWRWWTRAEHYHNGMVWPLVQGYWAWAAARAGAMDVFAAELDHLTGLAGRAPTFHEFYRPGSGRPGGSPRQLWSAAGYLAMVHYGLFGVAAGLSGIRFSPVIPDRFATLRLRDFAYRHITLDIEITGSGRDIAGFWLDDVAGEPVIPGDLAGRHRVRIRMAPRPSAVIQ